MADKDFNRSLSRYLSARKRWRPQYLPTFSLPRKKTRIMMEGGEVVEAEPEPSTLDRFKAWYGSRFTRSNESEDVDMGSLNSDFEAEPVYEAEEEPVQVELVQDMPDASGPGFFDRLKMKFSRSSRAEEDVSPQELFLDELKGDMKLVASNFVGVMETLSHRQREKVKATEEFDTIKEVFRKHNIIK